MAKKKPARPKKKSRLNARDTKTMGSLVAMADKVVQTASRSRAPHLDIPSRSLSNVKYNKSRKILEMG